MPVEELIHAASEYFGKQYQHLRLPLEGGDGKGLRRSQLGAIHAVGSHFTVHETAAIVVLPTGAGKTAVLMLAPYILGAKRALVVTPSRLVRDQIASGFESLALLRSIGAFPDGVSRPTVKKVEQKLSTEAQWNDLLKYSVAVGTPQVLSPGADGVAAPPHQLFDIVLIDEAHHAPARTWREIVETFPNAKVVLFTATPFRRDEREIKGRLIYSYPLRRAVADGIYGEIKYQPVTPSPGESPDLSIAKAAEVSLQADRAKGLRHLLMVRTDSKKRANELFELYKQQTTLRLRVVHSSYSQRTIDKVLEELRKGELDGVLAVSMMGEGFDLPELKIAAIHTPHKSLEVTLQFIGRFARTSGHAIGGATFLAIPNDIKIATERLYREDAVWQDLISNLSESRVAAETELREGLATFSVAADEREETEEELSLYAVHPYSHVKIYSVNADAVDLDAAIADVEGLEVIYRATSEELSATVLITRETTQPRWTSIERFEAVAHDLFAIYFDTDSKLLFINASRRSTALYEDLASRFTGGEHKILPLYRINRVLRGLRELDCFSLGMRSRVRSNSAETYRIMTGSKAQKALGPTEGRLFDRGHIFAKAVNDKGGVTIGYSSASKVWANSTLYVPEMVAWCKALAKELNSDEAVTTDSGLEHLPLSRPATAMPRNVIGIDWHEAAYRSPVELSTDDPNQRCGLWDCDLRLAKVGDDNVSASLVLSTPWKEYRLSYVLGGHRLFAMEDSSGTLTVTGGKESLDLIAFLNNYCPSFYLADFSRLSGEEVFSPPNGISPFDRAKMRTWDWAARGADITNEVGPTTGRGKSVQDCLEEHLMNDPSAVCVVKDHGTGEIADFVVATDTGNALVVSLYHCKGSGEPTPGRRVSDLYEVCGQVAKSLYWADRPKVLTERLQARVLKTSRVLKGNIQGLASALVDSPTKPIRYSLVVVQPGVSVSKLDDAQLMILAAAEHYVKSAGYGEMLVLASA